MTMTSGMKRFRSIVGPVLVVAAIFGPIAFLEASLRSNQTPKLSDPHSVQGTFIVGTMKKNDEDPYVFRGVDGREYAFHCDRIRGRRGLNICLYPGRGNPAGELSGRRVEVRYLTAQYPANYTGPWEPHLIILSVRENGRVLFRNSVWMKAAP